MCVTSIRHADSDGFILPCCSAQQGRRYLGPVQFRTRRWRLGWNLSVCNERGYSTHRNEQMKGWELLLMAQTPNPHRCIWMQWDKNHTTIERNPMKEDKWRLTNFCYRVESLGPLSTRIAQVLKSTVLAMRMATHNCEKRKGKSWDLLSMDGTDTSKFSQLHLNAIGKKPCGDWGNAHGRRQVEGYLTNFLLPRWEK